MSRLEEWRRARTKKAGYRVPAGRVLPEDREMLAPAQLAWATLAVAPEERAVDVSHWEEYNGGTGLAIMAEKHRVKWLYTKITEYRKIDKTVNQWHLAAKFGIKLGGFHFWRPGDAELEARLFLTTRAAYGYTDMPPILDFEHQAQPGAAICIEFWTFVDRIEQATGAQVWLYTGANYLPATAILRSKFRQRDVIIAAYPTPVVTLTEANQWLKASYSYQEPALLGWDPRRFKGWQFSASGRMTGCTSGGTDLDWIYPLGLGTNPPPTEPPADLQEARTTASLNVRSGPGTNYPVTGGLAAGTTVQVDERLSTGWAHIVDPQQGWVSEAYLSYV